MAIRQQPREDLLGEATAYKRRLLLAFTPPLAVTASSVAIVSGSPGSSSVASHAAGRSVEPFCPASARHAELFAGVRASGAWSLYFDEDPVIQLDERRQLRRLFWRDRKFLVERGELLVLSRDAVGGRLVHGREPLASDAVSQVLEDCRGRFLAAAHQLAAGGFAIIGTVPDADSQLLGELRSLLECLGAALTLAKADS